MAGDLPPKKPRIVGWPAGFAAGLRSTYGFFEDDGFGAGDFRFDGVPAEPAPAPTPLDELPPLSAAPHSVHFCPGGWSSVHDGQETSVVL